jgi:hypothetical protein
MTIFDHFCNVISKQQTSWLLVRKRTILIEGRSLSTTLVPTFAGRGCRAQSSGSPRPLNSVSLKALIYGSLLLY